MLRVQGGYEGGVVLGEMLLVDGFSFGEMRGKQK